MGMGYGLDGPGSIPSNARILSFPRRLGRIWGPTQPPIQWAQGAISPEVKRPGREADHSPPSSAEFKNGRGILLFPNMFSWGSA
jgi:hypothetical protein